MRFFSRLIVRIAGWVLLLGLGVVVGQWYFTQKADTPPLINVRQVVHTVLEREAAKSFFVTGSLDVSAHITEANTKYFMPEYFDQNISLGTTRSTVRLPGRISYGVDLSQVGPDAIEVTPSNALIIALPEVTIHAVEPHLDQMQISTEVGWARLHSHSGQHVEQRALRFAQEALRKNGQQHLATSPQPMKNTEEALRRLLYPVLSSAGVSNPEIIFRTGPVTVLPPRG